VIIIYTKIKVHAIVDIAWIVFRKETMKHYSVGIADITFYLMDEDGNIKEDKQGNEITYRIKDGIRFKPIEYLTEDLDVDMLEQERKK
jgi:hypothetical protein